MKRPYLDILDEQGNVVGRMANDGTMHGLGEGGAYVPWGRIGGDIWEFFHPGTVQREYEAVGKKSPDVSDIMEGAALDAGERINEGAVQVVQGTAQMGKWLVVGLVAYALIQGVQFLDRRRR